MNISLNEAINLRSSGLIYHENRAALRSSWVGTCDEIVGALMGDDGHHVERVGGRVVIWREGYPYPHFIGVGRGRFLCQFWGE